MKAWTIPGLVASAGLIGLGVALNNGTQVSVAYSTPLLVVGAAGGATCIMLWMVRSLASVPRVMFSRRDSARIEHLRNELVEASRQADARGVLTLADLGISQRQALFASGVSLLVNAEAPAEVRQTLLAEASRQGAQDNARRRRMATLCRVLPVAAMTLALTALIWVFTIGGGPHQLGAFAPLTVLLAVYGGFAASIAAVHIGDRLTSGAAEWELAGTMVIETIVAIAAGESPERVGELLRGMTPTGGAEAGVPALRVAA